MALSSSKFINLQYSHQQRYPSSRHWVQTFIKTLRVLYQELVIKWKETLKLALPAVLYLIQNNLQYVAATNLDAATFQITYQFKILTTAFFTVIMLNRRLSRKQWIALGLLTLGIAFVVLPKSNSQDTTRSPSSTLDTNMLDAENKQQVVDAVLADKSTIGNQFNMRGLLSVFMACILSGIAGVYFEKVIKSSSSSTSKKSQQRTREKVLFYDDKDDEFASALSYWIRNIQLSFSSVLLAAIFAVGVQDGSKIVQHGFFQNYSYLTWIVIFIQAAGGIIVGLVMRYADNILKGFATSISILVSSIISYGLFDFQITPLFIVGAIFVIYATYLYSN